jgi:hypothetical protein
MAPADATPGAAAGVHGEGSSARAGGPEGEIPCRAARRPAWKYAALAAAFAAWLAFLIYCAVAGN